MYHSLTHSQLYKTVAIALCLALICTLLPPVIRAGHFPGDTAHAAPLSHPGPLIPNSALLRSPSPQAQTPSPLSISRLQSAYTPSDIIIEGDTLSSTLVVTFTVTNDRPPAITPTLSETATLTDTVAALSAMETSQDPNLIRNVLLVNSLTGQAAFVSASPRPDRRGSDYVWNLGDLRPLESITVTLVLSTPDAIADVVALDTGARAWGTFQERMVNASACPVTLVPDEMDGEAMSPYLQTTVDADLYDEYVSQRAGQLCNPVQTFEYVRALGYEAYKGSLRGARGTEWSQAGNSLDQSSLLLAMLRGNGTPARYRHGTLDTARAQELILSMFPTTGAVVGYVPEGAEVSDPANDPDLLTEVQDHWWVEAYLDGVWTALDPSFSYAAPGQTFAAPEGEPLAEAPDEIRHKVTVSLEIERYDMLSYLHAGFVYTTPLTHTFSTAELVGQPLTLKHLVSAQQPPYGCLVFCWTHHTYAPYLRVGDQPWVIMGHQFWEMLSDYPFGQYPVTAEWLHFDLQAPSAGFAQHPSGTGQGADGNTRRYTREIADRIGMDQRESDYKIRGLIPELMTADVINRFGPRTPSLVNALDNHTIYFNPSSMSPEYAAHVGENLLATAPRVLGAQQIVSGLGDIERVFQGETIDVSGRLQVAEVAETVQDANQAFNRMWGASFVVFSDAASGDLAETGLVRAYPDSPRITLTSLVISATRTPSGTAGTPVQSMDLLYDSLRVVAHPGQTKGAEKVYRMTRGMNEAFLERLVGKEFIGEEGQSAAGVLQAATIQGIPLLHIDATYLEPLAQASLSDEANARILQATQQGYGVLVPERMVEWNEGLTTAWWQIDLETGETVGVSEDGTHQFIVVLTAEARLFAIVVQEVRALANLIFTRTRAWQFAYDFTQVAFRNILLEQLIPGFVEGKSPQQIAQEALNATKRYMYDTGWWAYRTMCLMMLMDREYCDDLW